MDRPFEVRWAGRYGECKGLVRRRGARYFVFASLTCVVGVFLMLSTSTIFSILIPMDLSDPRTLELLRSDAETWDFVQGVYVFGGLVLVAGITAVICGLLERRDWNKMAASDAA